MGDAPDGLTGLPGADLVRRGMAQLREGRAGAEALVLLLAATRLRALAVDVPHTVVIAEPDQALYTLLSRQDPATAHTAYNALKREIVSFAEALEARRRHLGSRHGDEP